MSNKKGRAYILSAPTGTGKTTLMQRLHAENPNVIQSISYTTRQPRAGEIPGRDYFFVSLGEFNRMKEAGDFLESISLYGHYYGTSKKWVESKLNEGFDVVLVIDTQGGLKLKQEGFEATTIFVQPPSIEELKARLHGRSTETSSAIEERLQSVDRELKEGAQYDYRIVNDHLDEAFEKLRKIIAR